MTRTMITMATSYKCYLKVKDCRQRRIHSVASVAPVPSASVSLGHLATTYVGAVSDVPSSSATKATGGICPQTPLLSNTNAPTVQVDSTSTTLSTNIFADEKTNTNGTVYGAQQRQLPEAMRFSTVPNSTYLMAVNNTDSPANLHSSEADATGHSSQLSANEPEEIFILYDVVVTICVDSDETPPLVNGSSTGLHLQSGRVASSDIMRQIKEQLHSQHGFDDLENSIIKAKNIRGSHIPLNLITVENCGRPRNALSIEICDRYSSVAASSNGGSFIRMSSHREEERNSVARNVCKQLEKRLADLERKLATRPKDRELYFEKQVEEISQRVDRLRNLINATNQVEWQGMIRRNPLW